eukprot:559261-Pelagomonas_calceolata.AAC.2
MDEARRGVREILKRRQQEMPSMIGAAFPKSRLQPWAGALRAQTGELKYGFKQAQSFWAGCRKLFCRSLAVKCLHSGGVAEPLRFSFLQRGAWQRIRSKLAIGGRDQA